MVFWLQLSYRWALPLEYQLAQCKAQPSTWITNQKLDYVMYRYFLAHAKKRVAGWNGWCNRIGNVRQCKGRIDLKQLCSSIRATPSNIPKQALCRLYKNSGSGEMRLMGWSWLDMIRNGKGAVGWDRHISPNMVEYPKRTQLGCPFSSYYVYILCYIYFRVFDRAMGMRAYRHVHNTIITCVRNIIPTIGLRAFGVAFGLSWAGINK